MAFPLLAEVSDKMLSWPTHLAWIAIVTFTGILGIQKKSWLSVVPLLAALLSAIGSVDLLRDKHMRAAVIQELGSAYIWLCFVPAVIITPMLLLWLRSSFIKRNEN